MSALLDDLERLCLSLEVLLTLNLLESVDWRGAIPLRVIQNPAPKGFAANHNAAFRSARGEYFCVLNPDVRLPPEVFNALLAHLRADPALGVVAPKVFSVDGTVEDSARPFPTARSLVRKLFGKDPPVQLPPRGIAYPDWIAGMFMLFPRSAFEHVGGFDESYFLYYEDVDLCARLRKSGYRVGYCADVAIVHDARRTSRRDLRYLRWHLSSMARFLSRRAARRL